MSAENDLVLNQSHSQMLQQLTRSGGKRTDAIIELQPGKAMPVWSPQTRYVRSGLFYNVPSSTSALFTVTFNRTELNAWLQNRGDAILGIGLTNDKREVEPLEMYLDGVFFVCNTFPLGNRAIRIAVYFTSFHDPTLRIPLWGVRDVSNLQSAGVANQARVFTPQRPIPIPIQGHYNAVANGNIAGGSLVLTDAINLQNLQIEIELDALDTFGCQVIGMYVTTAWG